MARLRRSSRQSRLLVINRVQTRSERIWYRELRSLFGGWTSRIAEMVRHGGASLVSEMADEFSADLSPVLRRLITHSVREMRDVLYRDVRRVLRKSAEDVFEEAVVAWIAERVLDRVTSISAVYFDSVRVVLDDSFRDGLSQEETAQRIVDVVGEEYTTWRAARIARTESHTASEIGTREAAVSTGLDMVKEWVAADDDRTRPTHVEASGQIREMADPFDVGGVVLMQPGDPSGPPEEIINCRCVALYHPRVGGEILR